MDDTSRLWLFAEIERGVEQADISRDAAIGSDKLISEICERKNATVYKEYHTGPKDLSVCNYNK